MRGGEGRGGGWRVENGRAHGGSLYVRGRLLVGWVDVSSQPPPLPSNRQLPSLSSRLYTPLPHQSPLNNTNKKLARHLLK